jgi:hypothetical protein
MRTALLLLAALALGAAQSDGGGGGGGSGGGGGGAAPLPLQISTLTGSPGACSGQSEGSIDAAVTGGQAPYTLGLSGPSNSVCVQQTPNGTETARWKCGSLLAGEYDVTVTDTANATVTLNVRIEDHSPLNVIVTLTRPARCLGDSNEFSITATGGKAPYVVDGGPEFNDAYVLERIGDLEPVALTDSAGCRVEVQAAGFAPEALGPPVLLELLREAGDGRWTISAALQGGSGNYAAAVCCPLGEPVSTMDTHVTVSFLQANLSDPRNVTLTAFDALALGRPACGGLASSQIDLTVPDLAISLARLRRSCAPRCSDGEIAARIEGGQPPYSFEWETHDSPPPHELHLFNLSGREMYLLRARDSVGRRVDSGPLDVTVLPLWSAELQVGDAPRCPGDQATQVSVSATFVAGPVQISWASTAGERASGRVLLEARGFAVSWVVSAEEQTNITIADLGRPADCCEASAAGVRTFRYNLPRVPAPLLLHLRNDTQSHSRLAIVTGGTPPYALNFSVNGSHFAAVPQLPATASVNVSAFPVGLYDVDVADSRGCAAALQMLVPAPPTRPIPQQPVAPGGSRPTSMARSVATVLFGAAALLVAAALCCLVAFVIHRCVRGPRAPPRQVAYSDLDHETEEMEDLTRVMERSRAEDL